MLSSLQNNATSRYIILISTYFRLNLDSDLNDFSQYKFDKIQNKQLNKVSLLFRLFTVLACTGWLRNTMVINNASHPECEIGSLDRNENKLRQIEKKSKTFMRCDRNGRILPKRYCSKAKVSRGIGR